MRGASPAFGVAVEFTYRAHERKGSAWGGVIAFTADKLKSIINFANHLVHANNPDSAFAFGFTRLSFVPGPLIVGWPSSMGFAPEVEDVFGELLSQDPVINQT